MIYDPWSRSWDPNSIVKVFVRLLVFVLALLLFLAALLGGLVPIFLSFLDSFLPFFAGGEEDLPEAPPDPETLWDADPLQEADRLRFSFSLVLLAHLGIVRVGRLWGESAPLLGDRHVGRKAFSRRSLEEGPRIHFCTSSGYRFLRVFNLSAHWDLCQGQTTATFPWQRRTGWRCFARGAATTLPSPCCPCRSSPPMWRQPRPGCTSACPRRSSGQRLGRPRATAWSCYILFYWAILFYIPLYTHTQLMFFRYSIHIDIPNVSPWVVKRASGIHVMKYSDFSLSYGRESTTMLKHMLTHKPIQSIVPVTLRESNMTSSKTTNLVRWINGELNLQL